MVTGQIDTIHKVREADVPGLKIAASYLCGLAFFKLGIGASLLAVGWDILNTKGDSLEGIAFVTAAAFLPSMFAKPLYNWVKSLSVQVVLAVILVGTSVSSFFIPNLLEFGAQIFAIYYFCIWVLIFLAEVIFEKWFVSVARSLDRDSARRLSSVSMALIQMSVILGPISVSLIDDLGSRASYILISVSFAMSGITAFFGPKAGATVKPERVATSHRQAPGKRLYVLAIAMIWPVMALFHMSCPVLAKSIFDSIGVAASLESSLGVSMALSGFLLLPTLATQGPETTGKIGLALLGVSTVALALGYRQLGIAVIAMGATGLSYGLLRIEMRSSLAKNYSDETAGSIVATANSLSGLLVPVVLLLGYWEYRHLEVEQTGEFTVLVSLPLMFLLSGALFWITVRATSERESNEP